MKTALFNFLYLGMPYAPRLFFVLLVLQYLKYKFANARKFKSFNFKKVVLKNRILFDIFFISASLFS